MGEVMLYWKSQKSEMRGHFVTSQYANEGLYIKAITKYYTIPLSRRIMEIYNQV